jgi:hypothetical protein
LTWEAGSRAGRHRRRSAREPAATAGAVRLAIRWRSGGGRLTSRPPPAAGSPKGALSRTQSSQISRRVVRLNRNRFGPFYCILLPFVVDFGFLELRGVPFGCFARPGLAKGCPKGSREGPGRSLGGSGWVRGGPGGVPWGPLGSRGRACGSFGGALARPWELFGTLGSHWGRLCGAKVAKPLRLSSEKLALESCVLVVWAALESSGSAQWSPAEPK